jgi:hypothetical protein
MAGLGQGFAICSPVKQARSVEASVGVPEGNRFTGQGIDVLESEIENRKSEMITRIPISTQPSTSLRSAV